MDIQTFYQTYLGEHELIRASLFNAGNFTTNEALIKYKMEELESQSALNEMFEHLSMSEAKLLRRLSTEESYDDVHRVSYLPAKYPTLIDYQYILEDNGTEGVIHSEVVNVLNSALQQTGIFPYTPMSIPDSETIEPQDVSRLEKIYNGPIYWLYNNLTFIELRQTMARLNIKSVGQYKDDYLNEVIGHLTAPEYLPVALSQLDEVSYAQIKDNVHKDYSVYENHPRWQTALETGLLVKVHQDYLVMHRDVLGALKKVDFKKSGNEDHPETPENYNAYRITCTINGCEDITRTISIPARMNFLELEIIICESFGWNNIGSGEFMTDKDLIANEDGVNKNALMVDVYLTNEYIQYLYDSDDDYVVDVTLDSVTNILKPLPEVVSYGGEVPIENIGGVDKLIETLNILQDKNHPDYVRTYANARTKNYRERYPVSATNKKLARLFNRGNPIT